MERTTIYIVYERLERYYEDNDRMYFAAFYSKSKAEKCKDDMCKVHGEDSYFVEDDYVIH